MYWRQEGASPTSPQWRPWWSRRTRWCPGTAGRWSPGSRRGQTPRCPSDCRTRWGARRPPAPWGQPRPSWPGSSWWASSCGGWWGPPGPPWCCPRCPPRTPAGPGTPTPSCTPAAVTCWSWRSATRWSGSRHRSSRCRSCLLMQALCLCFRLMAAFIWVKLDAGTSRCRLNFFSPLRKNKTLHLLFF